MYQHLGKALVVILVLYSCILEANCQISGISWIFRGTAQQNNTVLTFNQMDTLNLVCKASGSDMYNVLFVIHKGTAPTGMAYSSPQLTISGGGTLVYSDFDGPQSGYENIIVTTPGGSSYFTFVATAPYWFRQMNIGVLMQADAGTYHCSGMFGDGGTSAGYFTSSGGLTIVVNTKPGQARSSRAHYSSVLTYTSALLGASKLLF